MQLRTDLAPFLGGTRRKVVGLIASSIGAGFAEAASLILTVRVALTLSDGADGSIDLPVFGRDVSSTAALAVAAACALLALAFHVVIARSSAQLSSSVLANARTVAISRFVASGWPTQSIQSEGSLQETVSSLAARTSMLTQAMASGLSQAIMLVSFIITALVVDPLSAAGVILGGLVVVALVRPVVRATRRHSRALVAANLDYLEEVSRLASTSMELRVYGVQHEAERHLAHLNTGVQAKQETSRFYAMFGSSLYKDLGVLMLIVCIGALVSFGSGEVGSIGVVVTLIVRSLASAQQVSNSYQGVNENAPNLEALRERLEVLAAGFVPTGVSSVREIKVIEFRDVGYCYAGGAPAIDGLALRLEQGDSLGVVGPSGGGKSTFVQVLLRLRPPTAGSVLVNGVDYSDLDDKQWARMLGFVPQEPSLLQASIAENIGYYREISRDAIEAAAAEANVYDDIMRLPSGFDTVLGPRGSGLSGGQKQRVAIARALVGKPELLVMDEPSSALDIKSEQLLHEAVLRLKGRTTMVIVAHRLKTVESCDRLLVLQHGRIAQLGPPSELVHSDGFLRDVHRATN